LNILWLTMVRFEKPRVFLLKSSWTSSTAAELFSWAELQMSCAYSAPAELFSWAELQLSWAFSTPAVNLFDHTPDELASGQLSWGSLLNSLVKTGWTGPEGQFSWSLTPLTSDQQSASQTGKQVARGVRGGSTGLVNLGQTAGLSDSQTGRQYVLPTRGGSTALGGGSTGFR
jgi:hypothetical protein